MLAFPTWAVLMTAKSRFYLPYVLGALLAMSLASGWFLADAAFTLPSDPLLWGLLVIAGLVVRVYSFELNDVVTVSLDTVVYVTALFVIGTMGTVLLLVIVVAGHLSWEKLIRARGGLSIDVVLTIAFVTASIVFAVALASWLLGIDALLSQLCAHCFPVCDAGAAGLSWAFLWRIFVATLVIVTVQYSIALTRHYFAGQTAHKLFRGVFVPGLIVEAVLSPLTVMAVFSFHRALWSGNDGNSVSAISMGFVLALYVLAAIGIRRLTTYGALFRARLSEMERLNDLYSKIAVSLQMNLLCEMAVEALLDTFQEIEAAAIILPEENLIKLHVRSNELEADFATKLRDFSLRPETVKSRPSHVGRTEFLPLLAEASGFKGTLVVQSSHPGRTRRETRRLWNLLRNILRVAIQNARLYEMATIDGLTGLYVRRYFEQRLAEEFRRSKRYGDDFTLIVIDLNYFKQVNDRYGHLVGDRILKIIGEVLRDSVRSMDVPARYGGDEFSILLPRASLEDAEIIQERILEGIERCVIELEDDRIGVSAASGMACYTTDKPEDPTAMILIADDRLYEAKKNRRKPLYPGTKNVVGPAPDGT
jgi:diguanylate cyclase (GGDEF)-like protein